MSKKINAKETTAARMRQAVFEWLGGVGDWDEGTRGKMADELAKHVGNQLYLAAQAKEDLLAISLELEGAETKTAPPLREEGKGDAVFPPAADAPKWGPQWKD